MRPDDIVREASYDEVAEKAVDPRLFNLAEGGGFDPAKPTDWVWAFSLTRRGPVLVPANLVFLPYEPASSEKVIAWNDSNGLASGNNFEEAVLHGLLEVIERDGVMISEYNRLPPAGLSPAGIPAECGPTLEILERRGFRWAFMIGLTDLPFPFIAAFLRRRENPSDCSVAFGCHLDPALALARALTEAIQVLPPSINHEEWLRSGSPERYASPSGCGISFQDMKNLASIDLKDNIEKCVAILRDVGSEVIIVDLSLPEIPFPAVQVLATGLQPLLHEGDMRLSQRFFEVPAKLGLRAVHRAPAEIKMWPLCGYR